MSDRFFVCLFGLYVSLPKVFRVGTTPSCVILQVPWASLSNAATIREVRKPEGLALVHGMGLREDHSHMSPKLMLSSLTT